MKKAVKIPLTVVGSLVGIIILMAVFDICPPQGPWPMPPWCEMGDTEGWGGPNQNTFTVFGPCKIRIHSVRAWC